MSKNHIEHLPSSGFTLIEVLVALAIAGLGLSFLIMAAGTGLESTSAADQYIQATRRAQSRLAAVGVTGQLRPGEQSGDDGGGYAWRLRVSEPVLHATRDGGDEKTLLGLYSVELTVRWRSGVATREVSLQSQRLGIIAGGNG